MESLPLPVQVVRSARPVKGSFQRLIDDGMQRIFGALDQDQQQNKLLLQLKSCLVENEAIIDKVYVRFVFTGDPAEAERSKVLDKLREDLENKKYLIDQRFGWRRSGVSAVNQPRSARSPRATNPCDSDATGPRRPRAAQDRGAAVHDDGFHRRRQEGRGGLPRDPAHRHIRVVLRSSRLPQRAPAAKSASRMNRQPASSAASRSAEFPQPVAGSFPTMTYSLARM
jgi:hypothetical protein